MRVPLWLRHDLTKMAEILDQLRAVDSCTLGEDRRQIELRVLQERLREVERMLPVCLSYLSRKI
jgi:hypothetical protein